MIPVQLESAALALPLQERAALAHRLLLSLEELTQTEFERVWAEESARRITDFDASGGQAISGDDVANKARALLR